MGRRGPPPTPTQLKILRGNPGHRPLPKGEPVPRSTRIQPPRYLGPIARAAFRKIVRELEAMRVRTTGDGIQVELAALAYERARISESVVRTHGAVVVEKKLGPRRKVRDERTRRMIWAREELLTFKPRPEVAIEADAWRRCQSALDRLGLSPSALSRVTSGGTDAPVRDPLQRFFAPQRAAGG